MNYTDKRPQVPGFYWMQYKPDSGPLMIELVLEVVSPIPATSPSELHVKWDDDLFLVSDERFIAFSGPLAKPSAAPSEVGMSGHPVQALLEIRGCKSTGRGSRFFTRELIFGFAPQKGQLVYFEGQSGDWAKAEEVDWFIFRGEAKMQLKLYTGIDLTEDFDFYLWQVGWVECNEFAEPLHPTKDKVSEKTEGVGTK